jgi:transposase
MSATTVAKGMREVQAGETIEAGRVRRAGGGRRPLTQSDPTLLSDLRALVEDEARGDPESPLLWTAKSVRSLARSLREQGHRVSHETVAKLLRALGYSLQANRKMTEGASHPDRDAQFRHINEQVKSALEGGQPAISVDTKKKELVGDFKNPGRQWRPEGEPVLVRTKDFKDKQLGKVNPTASTTSPTTRGGSASASTPIPPSSRSRRSAAGGATSATRATQTRPC